MNPYILPFTPVGALQITSNGTHIVKITFLESSVAPYLQDEATSPGEAGSQDLPNTPDALCLRCGEQLLEYFAGVRRRFDLPLAPSGTPFQRAVWARLMEIPYGHTVTYGELAALAGRPGAARAAGSACGKNPIPIVIPCHRVLSAGGLGGYSGGKGLFVKKELLALEEAQSQSPEKL